MNEVLEYLRQLNFASLSLRLLLAMLLGGMIGMERARKGRAAGFRTYILVCMGAALTMLLGQYFHSTLEGIWGQTANTDVARMGAQVINGIGFLGAGTIIVTGRQEVKGLTTAAGLWASACMGLAVGAGFYECVLLAFVLIVLSIRVLPRVENYAIENTRNLNIYVEFESMEDLGHLISRIKKQDVQILDVEFERVREEHLHPCAIFVLRMKRKMHHAQFLAAISQLETIRYIEEL